MDRPRLIRGLRIAVSGVFAVACVLSIAMLVRSYSCRDVVAFGAASGPGYVLESAGGAATFVYFPLRTGYVLRGWDVWSEPAAETLLKKLWLDVPDFFGFRFKTYSSWLTIAVLPLWFLAVLAATLTAAPWVRWRFSLRMLLIATTLIAILLATAAYLRLW